MSNAPVVSITDELVAELEKSASRCISPAKHESLTAQSNYDALCRVSFSKMASPATILDLLRERAEMQQQIRAAMISVDNCELFRKDAERYKYLCEASLIVGIGWDHDGHFSPDPKAELDAAVDKAMGATE